MAAPLWFPFVDDSVRRPCCARGHNACGGQRPAPQHGRGWVGVVRHDKSCIDHRTGGGGGDTCGSGLDGRTTVHGVQQQQQQRPSNCIDVEW